MDGGLTCLTWNLWWRFDDWRARLRAITSILHGSVDGVWPSDHAGVLTELIMTPPPPREPAQQGPG